MFKGTDVTAANSGLVPGSGQWVVNLTLDSAAAQAFGALTTTQFNNYYPNAGASQDDAVLDQTAMALDGDVVSAPQNHGRPHRRPVPGQRPGARSPRRRPTSWRTS